MSAKHSDTDILQMLEAFEAALRSHPSKPSAQPTASAPLHQGQRRLFVTGTGTEIGKTVVTTALATALRRQGHKVAAVKPVETGCEPTALDATRLADACGRPQLASAPGLYRAARPAAPLAATRAGEQQPPTAASLAEATLAAGGEADWLIAEGAGGLLVPLDEGHTIADLARKLSAELIVVAPDVLGTLSHTLTAVESARSRKLPIACVVLNRCNETEPAAPQSNLAILRGWLAPIPVVAFPETCTDSTDANASDAAQASATTKILSAIVGTATAAKSKSGATRDVVQNAR